MLKNASLIYRRIAVHLWRAIEIHIYKIVIIVIAIYCLHKVNFLNLLLFFAILSGLLMERIKSSEKRIRSVFSVIFQLWISILTLCSMIYNMTFIDLPLTFNCTFDNESLVDPYLLQPHNITDYIGIQKYDNMFEYLIVSFTKKNMINNIKNLKLSFITYSFTYLYFFC